MLDISKFVRKLVQTSDKVIGQASHIYFTLSTSFADQLEINLNGMQHDAQSISHSFGIGQDPHTKGLGKT